RPKTGSRTRARTVGGASCMCSRWWHDAGDRPTREGHRPDRRSLLAPLGHRVEHKRMKITEPGIYRDITEADYRADPFGGSFTQSLAKVLNEHSPLHAR